MTEMACALLKVYPAMAMDQYESQEFYGEKMKLYLSRRVQRRYLRDYAWIELFQLVSNTFLARFSFPIL